MNALESGKNFWSSGLGARFYRAFSGRHYRKMHEKVAEEILKRNPIDVLDIACGSGNFLEYLTAQAPQLRLRGTDFAPGMVVVARERLNGKAKISKAVGETQPFPNASFDAVIIMMAFHHFPKKLEAFKEAQRLLRPGGVLVIADVVARSDVEKKFWNIVERVATVRGHIDHHTELDLQKLGEEAGFRSTSTHVPGMSTRYKIISFSV